MSYLLRSALVGLLFFVQAVFSQTVLFEDFEQGIGGWYATNGQWDVGAPTYGPDPYSGQQLAATNLHGNYSPDANTWFVSPPISLPSLDSSSQRILLKFRHYHSFARANGRVEVSTDQGQTWQIVSATFGNHNNIWAQTVVDLTTYADSTILLGFHFWSSHGPPGERAGWYLDDVLLEKKTPVFANPEGFENGFGDWSAQRGNWNVGVPSGITPYSGQRVAATNTHGNYPPDADSRLLSPLVTLPSLDSVAQRIELKFWHYHSFARANGRVEVSTDQGQTWQIVSATFGNHNNIWAQTVVDLTTYANSTILLGFHFWSSHGPPGERAGWYLDEVSIEKTTAMLGVFEGFENGPGSWNAQRGNWNIGVPSGVTPYEGQHVAATNIRGNYPPDADSRLISPPLAIPSLSSGEWVRLKFRHRHSFNRAGGQLQVQTSDGVWHDDQQVFSGHNANWTQYILYLSQYSGDTIRVAFHFWSSHGPPGETSGWYIDAIEVESNLTSVATGTTTPFAFHLDQNYPNPFNPATTITFQLPKASNVSLVIFNALGQEVARLYDQVEFAPGNHKVEWDASSLPSGVYYYRLRTNDHAATRKMIVLK